jgi:radical SAM superfamily enzyme YgiQ (UPF0313 family)
MKRLTIVGALAHSDEQVPPERMALLGRLLAGDAPLPRFADFLPPHVQRTPSRHIYASGIVLFNYFTERGFDVSLVNILDEATPQDLERLAASDFVLLSTSHIWEVEPCEEAIARLRALCPKGTIVVGGWLIFFLLQAIEQPDAALRFTRPEAQRAMERLANAGARIFIGSRRGLEEALNAIEHDAGAPVRCFDGGDYPPLGEAALFRQDRLPEPLQAHSAAITTSTGCPFNCRFCSYKLRHRMYKFLGVPECVALIEKMLEGRTVPLRHIRFGDEVLNYPARRLAEICQRIIDKELCIDWSCFAHVGNIDEELARLMARAGCSLVSIGLESGDFDMRVRMNKGFEDEEFAETVHHLRRAGIVVSVSLLIGFVGETGATLARTKALLEQTRPDVAKANVWDPSVRFALTDLARDFDLEMSGPFWRHRTMDVEQAVTGAAWLIKNTEHVAFAPALGLSYFDVWPWLRGEGLSSEVIVDATWAYHRAARDRIRGDLVI